jgi:AmiR/NasT family two-component response regulator
MDIKMPGLDGLSAPERISGQRIAPVLVLTAFGQRELVDRAARTGAMGYLVKPFQKGDVVPAIELAVARYREAMTLESEVEGLTGAWRPGRSWTGPRGS